jgi:hypothetical protein
MQADPEQARLQRVDEDHLHILTGRGGSEEGGGEGGRGLDRHREVEMNFPLLQRLYAHSMDATYTYYTVTPKHTLSHTLLLLRLLSILIG